MNILIMPLYNTLSLKCFRMLVHLRLFDTHYLEETFQTKHLLNK